MIYSELLLCRQTSFTMTGYSLLRFLKARPNLKHLCDIYSGMINIKRIKEVSLLQQDSTDCGAACLASANRYFGGNCGIDKIRRLSGTTQSGTTMLGLYQAAQECGMEATGYEASVSDIMKFTGILILHVTPQNDYEHYVVSYGLLNGKFILWDPVKGFSENTVAEIEKIWLSHKCLAVSPGKDFVFEDSIKSRKRRWVIDTVKPEYELLITSVFVGVVIALLG
jgi:ATP-binding cassette subfamily B protein